MLLHKRNLICKKRYIIKSRKKKIVGSRKRFAGGVSSSGVASIRFSIKPIDQSPSGLWWPISNALSIRVFFLLFFSGLDSPRSSAAASPDAISGRPVDTPSEDDYEVLNYKKQEEQVEVKAEEEKVNSGTYSQAQENEEIVISEPIYTMVIKSPKPLRAVDWDEKVNAEPDKIIPTADDNRAEEEAEPEERNAGDGQTESPVMWEYKLPAPPTPFQDSGDSPMDKLQFASVTESNHSRPGSSMSADSLQEQSSADEEEVERPKIVTGIDTTVELCHGKELVEESNTEDVPLDCSTDVVEQVVVLEPSDPEAKQFGIESTTDEQPLSLPPAVPSTLPPCDSEDSSLQSEMKFSIATYNIRTTEDSTYDKKLSRSNSPDEMPANLIASPIGNKLFIKC